MLDSSHPPAVQTTGYTWDGDIQEFNNLPPQKWWRGLFATIIFAVCCWLLYPAWPLGRDYTKGVLNHIIYYTHQQKISSHWNTRALLFHNLQQEEPFQQRHKYLQQLSAIPLSEITPQPQLMNFAQVLGKRLSLDNCAPCHGKKIDFSRFDQIEQSPHGSCISIWKNRLTLAEIKSIALYHLTTN